MDIRLQELLEKIKREGVEAAQSQAAAIIAEAESKAAAIVAGAEKQTKVMLLKAQADVERADEAGRKALEQAARDLILALKDRLAAVLDAAVKHDAKAAFGPEILAEAIPAALKAIAAQGSDELAVQLPQAMIDKLGSQFASRLAAELKQGVELKPYPDLDAGFRIVERNGQAYYDFSAEAVASLLSRRLNSRLAESVRKAAQGA